MAYNLQDLADKSGENQGSELRFDVPMLTLEGEEGYFRLTQNKVETKLDGNVEGVMLKIRCQYGAYLNEGERILFTDEQNTARDTFELLEITQGKNGKKFTNVIDRGTGKELKERNPDLKFKQMIYFLLDGKIVKLQVKGSSLTNLFRTEEQAKEEKTETGYFNQFGKDEHIFQVWTTLEAEKYSKKIGAKVKTFYRIKFVKGNELPKQEMEKVAEKINYIFDKIQAIEKAKSEKNKGEAQNDMESQALVEAYDDGQENYEYQE